MRLLPLVLLLALLPAQAAEQVGQMRNAAGTISVRHESDREFQVVESPEGEMVPVFNLDTWQTGPESTCEIYLDNGSIFVLMPESVLLIRINPSQRTVAIEMSQGSIKAITINSPEYQTNVLTPSAFVTQQGGIFINRVLAEGQLRVENEQGVLSIVHNYGTELVLGDGQSAELVTDFSTDRRIFSVQVPAENTGSVVARIVDRVSLELPPGTTTSIENGLIVGQGGEIVIEASQDNRDLVVIGVGDVENPIQTYQTQPGERVVIRFEPDIEIEIEVGDLTPRTIPRPELDDPFELPGDIVPPVPRIIPVIPSSPHQ